MALNARTLNEKLAGPAVVVMLLGLVVIASFSFFRVPAPQPYSELKAQVLTEAVPPGGPLVVRLSGYRNKICGVTAMRSFRNLDSRRIVHAEMAPSGFAPLGSWSNEMEIALPLKMGPGVYAMSSIAVNDCGEEVIPVPFPEIVFRIINQD